MVDKRFIDTPILNEQFRAVPHASGEDNFALEENAVKAVFKISTDTNVNGKVLRDIGEKEAECSQEIDRCFDLGYDDFAEGDPFKMFQEIALRDDKQQSKI
jgi:hypothetical protein